MAKVVKFYSDSCAPCKAMSPTFDAVVKEIGIEAESKNIGHEGVRELAMEAGVRAVPSFVVYLDDGEVHTKSGAMSMEALRTFIEGSLIKHDDL